MGYTAKNLGETCAYPTGHFGDPGMTLRQHFAGLAMQAVIGAQEATDERKVAAYAVDYADALLAELAKET